MRRRLAALRAAVLLAAGFVVLRVVYRVLFGGASGGGVLLLDPPRIRLSGPFEHVTLFGPVTTGGLVNVVVSAVPFAAVVLAFGLLNVIVDLRALLSRGAVRGPLRTVSRALVVAWATFPALVDAVRRVRIARDLRGVRGPASLLVPVLEQTVERAIAVGASMEVRGFAAVRRAEPQCEHPVVVRDAALGYDGRWTLEHLDLTIEPGTLTLLAGPTGSGKSTLLHALSGVFQHVRDGEQRGIIEVAGVDRSVVPPRETAGFVGVVPQSIRLSFVAPTVADEIGFSLAIRGVASVIVRARVEEIAQRLGIMPLLDRDTAGLSAGEACLVAIGAALVERPVVLLADEPLAELDDAARVRVLDLLAELAHSAGVAVVVAEHDLSTWHRSPQTAPDRVLELREGALQPFDGVPAAVVEPAPREQAPHPQEPLVSVEHLTVHHGDRLAVDDVSFAVGAGERVALRGPNGAGKSSLMGAIALPGSHRGVVTIGGVDLEEVPRRQRRHRVALVPERFEDLLFRTTVAEECRTADRSATAGGTAARFQALLGGRDVSALLGRHPRDLSAGERLCLVLAIQLSAEPMLLLVDEPSRGLDAQARELVGDALIAAADAGTAVLFATHDDAFADRFAARQLAMADGRVHARAESGLI